MKTLFYLFIITAMASFTNSHKVSKVYTDVAFDKAIADTLLPLDKGPYTTKLVKLKGNVDDSIYVSFGEGYNRMYFTGEFDTIIGVDYYGTHKAVFVFDPYKAKGGNLRLELQFNNFIT